MKHPFMAKCYHVRLTLTCQVLKTCLCASWGVGSFLSTFCMDLVLISRRQVCDTVAERMGRALRAAACRLNCVQTQLHAGGAQSPLGCVLSDSQTHIWAWAAVVLHT